MSVGLIKIYPKVVIYAVACQYCVAQNNGIVSFFIKGNYQLT